MKKLFLFFCLPFIFACSSSNPTDNHAQLDLSSGVFTLLLKPSGDYQIQMGQTVQLETGAILKDGSVMEHVEVDWSSSDQDVATVTSEGFVKALKPGHAVLIAVLDEAQAQLNLEVLSPFSSLNPSIIDVSKNPLGNNAIVLNSNPLRINPSAQNPPESEPLPRRPENPAPESQGYLGADDVLTPTLGPNAGFGQDEFPDNIFGPPDGSGLYTLGAGGSLLIELRGYIVVDGPGADFTLFENPFLFGQNFYAERAEISVSLDGHDFRSFPCDAFDEEGNYEGCAGVHPTGDRSQARNPALSGGDSFDLRDVGLTHARFILIRDLNTCRLDPTPLPVCGAASKEGFDMDALAIVNGVNL